MTVPEEAAPPPWAGRAADRSPAVQRSRDRSARRAKVLVDAAKRLIMVRGGAFTTQELAKEAGVALQTFYRHFASKDQLLLAVFEDIVAEEAVRVREEAHDLLDPVARLRLVVTSPFKALLSDDATLGARHVTAEHWRLHQHFPEEIAQANQPYVDVVEEELRAGVAAGVLGSTDPHKDAWLTMNLVRSVYHHYAYADRPDDVDAVIEHLWQFCLIAFGGRREEGNPADGRRTGLLKGT